MAHRNFSATSARQIRQCCRVYQTIDVVERRGFSEWVASDWAIRTDHGWVKHKPLRSWWNFYYTCDSPRLSESPSRLRPNRICIDNPSFAILSLQTLLFCAVSIDDLFWCVHDYSFHWSIRISISWHLFPDRPTQNLKREKRQAIYKPTCSYEQMASLQITVLSASRNIVQKGSVRNSWVSRTKKTVCEEIGQEGNEEDVCEVGKIKIKKM